MNENLNPSEIEDLLNNACCTDSNNPATGNNIAAKITSNPNTGSLSSILTKMVREGNIARLRRGVYVSLNVSPNYTDKGKEKAAEISREIKPTEPESKYLFEILSEETGDSPVDFYRKSLRDTLTQIDEARIREMIMDYFVKWELIGRCYRKSLAIL